MDPVFDLLMYTPILAHLGHWYVSLPVFMGPVVAIVAWLQVSSWRERRRGRAGGHQGSGRQSRIETTYEPERARISVVGALDRAALVDLECELDVAAGRARVLVLDLRRVGSVDQSSAAELSEVLGSAPGDVRLSAVMGSRPAHDVLKRVCVAEGLEIVDPVGAIQP